MATAAPPPLAGLSVLVVEDHQDTLDMFEAYLQYCGAQVVTVVRSAQEALACLDGRHLDAITTDVSLHPQRAADFVSKVREREEYRRTPIIAVSGWTGKDFDPAALGFTAFVLKPVELDMLVGTIMQLVQRRRRGPEAVPGE